MLCGTRRDWGGIQDAEALFQLKASAYHTENPVLEQSAGTTPPSVPELRHQS